MEVSSTGTHPELGGKGLTEPHNKMEKEEKTLDAI